MTYQSPEDEKAFRGIIARDPECKKCFECGYPSPQWCDIHHGIFVCLDCSGGHRGLGTHLSFVRSSTMDGWSNWRPEKLKQMEIGGNTRARKYFEAKGVPKAPLQARYQHEGALMYMAMLEAEATGNVFDEKTWRPPEWLARVNQQQQQQQQRPNGAGGRGTVPNDRFQGVGSQGSYQQGGRQNSAQGDSDWYSSLSSGWAVVAQRTGELAQSAVANATTLADEAGKKLQQANVQQTASDSVSAVSTGLSWGWSAVASFATQIAQQATTQQTSAEEDDGLSALTRNVQRDDVPRAPPDDSRYGHIEHRRQPSQTELGNDDEGAEDLRSIARNLPRGGNYQGVGSTPSRPPAQASGEGRSPPPAATSTPTSVGTPVGQPRLSVKPVAKASVKAKKDDDWDWN